MSTLADFVATASRRHKDVRIVLDGELADERAELVKAAVAAANTASKRLAGSNRAQAQEALDNWDAQHADRVLTVRVNQCSLSQWREIQRRNPVAANKEHRDQLDGVKGYAVIPASLDAIEQHGQIIIGDEVEKPSPAEWKKLWDVISPGDAYMFALAVIQVMEETTEQAFGELVKR